MLFSRILIAVLFLTAPLLASAQYYRDGTGGSVFGTQTQAYVTPGTYTFRAPRSALYYVTGCGAGGGGGGGNNVAGGGGGGGGGKCWSRVPVYLAAGDTVTVTVNAGGAGGAINAAGTTGLRSLITLGAVELFSASGGSGGQPGTGAAGGASGAVGGSYYGVTGAAAGVASSFRSAFGTPANNMAPSSNGSGGGHPGTPAGLGNVVASDISVASTGDNGGGHGGTTLLGFADSASMGLGGATGVAGSTPAALNCGAGGGGGGGAPGAAGGNGAPGCLFLQW